MSCYAVHEATESTREPVVSQKLFDRVIPAGKICATLSLRFSRIATSAMCETGPATGRRICERQSHARVLPKSDNIAEKIRQACLEESVLTYPTQGCVDGLRGDHILLAPPFTISPEESALIPRALHAALARVFPA